jgi:hypothetical protein
MTLINAPLLEMMVLFCFGKSYGRVWQMIKALCAQTVCSPPLFVGVLVLLVNACLGVHLNGLKVCLTF